MTTNIANPRFPDRHAAIAPLSRRTEAVEYASHIDPKVVLLDGDDLVQMMIDHGLGVSSVATYEIKIVDMDFFVEE